MPAAAASSAASFLFVTKPRTDSRKSALFSMVSQTTFAFSLLKILFKVPLVIFGIAAAAAEAKPPADFISVDLEAVLGGRGAGWPPLNRSPLVRAWPPSHNRITVIVHRIVVLGRYLLNIIIMALVIAANCRIFVHCLMRNRSIHYIHCLGLDFLAAGGRQRRGQSRA